MVSMKDVARVCGVSVATVSKALNGRPDIGRETRERVCAAAQALGYLSSAAAQSLRTNRTYNIGVLFVDEQHSGLGHQYFSSLLNSFKVEAESRGYDITFLNSNVGGRPMSYLQHCLYRGLDGVALACVDFLDPMVQELVDSEIPLVTIDHVFRDRPAVLSDNMNGVESLVRYIWGMGHRRIAFLHGENTFVTQGRLAGFRKACRELELDTPADYVIPCAYHDPDRCREAVHQLLELPQPPSCILFPDDFSYVGGMNAILEAGLQVPEDISAVGYDGISLARVLHLTTYSQNTAALGETAARSLIHLIEHPKTAAPGSVLIPGRLMEGSTVKKL